MFLLDTYISEVRIDNSFNDALTLFLLQYGQNELVAPCWVKSGC